MPVDYARIPEEMRWDRAWCVAGPDEKGDFKAPYTVGSTGLYHAKVIQSHQWKDIETIIDAATSAGYGIGYVLARGCGYTCIDLDIKNVNNYPNNPELWTPQENIDRYHKIITTFDSYTERSASGQGFHIWIRGTIPNGKGVKRDGVEVYSQERFIVCTGNVYLDRDIEERQALLETLLYEISLDRDKPDSYDLVEVEAEETDQAIFTRATQAENAEKFIKLCEGHWQDDYPSQSEADLSLMSMFAFYSKSNSQCRRLFRMTELGKRDKSMRNDVALDRNLVIIRSRQQHEANMEHIGEQATKRLLESLAGKDILEPAAAMAAYLGETLEEPKIIDPSPDGIPWPPGMTGVIAYWIFQNSPRPVKEVSIVAALGFMAGLCGKAFVIPQSGLNLYLVLVARSAIGKEAMHSGIANLIKCILDIYPDITNFVDFTDYASGPALTKAVAANSSFVNVSGEWGRKLKRLSQEDGKDGPMQQLRTVMTNLYQKSGPASIVGGIGYSDKEKNIASISGASYSMIGETTPNTFYESLTDQMMEDGFMSRFTVIEYSGQRPEANHVVVQPLDYSICSHIAELAKRITDANEHGNYFLVEREEKAAAILEAFDKECDIQINNTTDESWRQMWNRAHLKAYRIAALLAVGEDCTNPIIQVAHVNWAIDLIRRDMSIMQRRMDTGDVGSGDGPRERKVLSLIQTYLEKPLNESYKIPDSLRLSGIVPRRYLQITTQRVTAFSGHRLGLNMILDSTLKSLVASGYLMEVPRPTLVEKHGFQGVAYRVITLPKQGAQPIN